MYLQDWLAKASQQIQELNVNSPLFEARLLAEKVTGQTLTQLRWANIALSTVEFEELEQLLARRLKKEPIAYIIGQQPFFGLEITVNQSTLIPRPETEQLVEIALNKLPEDPCKILDLGTGSGAISCAVAHQRPDCRVTGVEQSNAALKIAQQNADKYKLTNITWLLSNWFEAVKETKFDMIISNPPYIDPEDSHLKALSYEPLSALTSKDNGYYDLQTIITEAPYYLKECAWLVLEHGYQQAKKVQSIAVTSEKWWHIQTIKDYASCDRITIMQKVGPP